MSREIITAILKVPDEKWWESIFRRDPMYDRLDSLQKDRFTICGLKCGQDYADEVLNHFQCKKLSEIVKALGVDIIYKTTYGIDGLLVFAQFSAPKTIILFSKNLEMFEEYKKREQIDNLPISLNLEELLIAHELFHYFEENDPKLAHHEIRFESFKFGPIKLNSKLIAVSEIAAMSFARRITNTLVNPCVLDILLQLPHNYERAVGNLNIVLEDPGKVMLAPIAICENRLRGNE
ncbi:MAG: hypothetical protein M0P11_00160 [Anaerolineaceae bacterium]|nr:hypothetical protein [Anaerolineaceae bacterium]